MDAADDTSAVTIDVDCSLPSRFAYSRERFPELDGNPSGALLDVYTPAIVERIREINSYPREFVVLLFLDPKPQPVAGHEQPIVAVNEETLVCDPALRSTSEGVLLRSEF